MRQRLHIPHAVVTDIEKHVVKAIDETVAAFDSAWEDEDVVTGHLGGQLTTRQRSVLVTDAEVNGIWKWSLRYSKFRGRGGGATERALGADGIFEFILEEAHHSRVKSILFQSKMAGSGQRGLVEQCARLSTWREAAFVVLYDVGEFKAITLDAALQVKGKIEDARSNPLAKFLVDEFIGCNVGDSDLHYVPASRELIWYSIKDETVAVRFSIPNRFRLKVIPPKRGLTLPRIDKYIKPDQIHHNRMKVTPEDMLRVQYEQYLQSPREAVRQLARVYHTDFFANSLDETLDLLKARLQEFNEARSEIESRSKKRTRHQSRDPYEGDAAQNGKEDASPDPAHLSSHEPGH